MKGVLSVKFILSFILCFVLILPVFSAEENITGVNKENNNTVLKGEAECEMLPPIDKEVIKPVRKSLTNIEYDIKYLQNGKAKNFERSNIEYSGVTDFFNY